MKAIVLAGGSGSRLRPLTYTRPKPMLRIVGKPVVEHIIEYLRSFGIYDIILTTNYLKSQIVDYIGDGQRFGVNVTYPQEEDPMGTAGSVKNIQHLLNETFLVIQGDNITDFDLHSLIMAHKKSGALATMAVHPVHDPEHYGVVVSDEFGKVKFFQEKPSPGDCKSNMINTGIYILEPEILEFIPPNTKFDFSKDLFPILCGRGLLCACPLEGFWTDIGQPTGFREARDWMLSNMKAGIPCSSEIKGELEGVVLTGERVYVGKNTVLLGPVVVGRDTIIEDNCFIGPNTSIGSNLVVKEGSVITESTLFEGSCLGGRTHLSQAIVAENCTVGYNSDICSNTMVGSNCSLGLSVNVESNSRIWPNMRIEHGSSVSGDLRTFWQTQDIKYTPLWSLRNLSLDEAFYFNKQEENLIKHTGYVAKNLLQFNSILHNVDLSSIAFHLRHDLNDFSEWARKIICDPLLAQGFDKAKVNLSGRSIDSVRRDLIVETTTRLNAIKNKI